MRQPVAKKGAWIFAALICNGTPRQDKGRVSPNITGVFVFHVNDTFGRHAVESCVGWSRGIDGTGVVAKSFAGAA